MRLAAAGLALALISAVPFSARSAEPSAETFAERSLKAGRIQASLARLAAQRAEHADVRRFAAALQRDLEARNARLAAIVRAAGMRAAAADLPANTTHEIPQRTREFHRLRVRTGEALDRQFLRAVIVYYENAVRGYEAEAASGSDAARRFAANSLPRLKRDLGQARRLLAAIGDR
jgi:predicted outer membrane protein